MVINGHVVAREMGDSQKNIFPAPNPFSVAPRRSLKHALRYDSGNSLKAGRSRLGQKQQFCDPVEVGLSYLA